MLVIYLERESVGGKEDKLTLATVIDSLDSGLGSEVGSGEHLQEGSLQQLDPVQRLRLFWGNIRAALR